MHSIKGDAWKNPDFTLAELKKKKKVKLSLSEHFGLYKMNSLSEIFRVHDTFSITMFSLIELSDRYTNNDMQCYNRKMCRLLFFASRLIRDDSITCVFLWPNEMNKWLLQLSLNTQHYLIGTNVSNRSRKTAKVYTQLRRTSFEAQVRRQL